MISLQRWLRKFDYFQAHDFFSDSDDLFRQSVMHPPHLTGSENEKMPSALIPFCSYQSEALGNKISGYEMLSCNRFQPTLLNGRICYSHKQELGKGTKQGKKHGLLLMIDPGQLEEDQDEDEESSSFKIYIHTLSGFSGFKTGSYALSSLKKMTGTSGFMSLPDEQKRCQIEVFEDCQSSRFLEELQKQCGCIPWTIGSKHTGKVSIN